MSASLLTQGLAAQEPFKNPTATTAPKEYEEAITRVRKAYVAKLEQALKEARQASDTEETIRIAKVRNGITDVETPRNPAPVDSFRLGGRRSPRSGRIGTHQTEIAAPFGFGRDMNRASAIRR